jgi:GTP pyrophosphokinase
MVKIRDVHEIYSDAQVNIAHWVQEMADKLQLSPENLSHITTACELSYRVEHQVEDPAKAAPYRPNAFLTGMEMAEILTDLKMEEEGIVAALLYRHVRERRLDIREVEAQFGKGVASLITNVMRMAVISHKRNDSGTEVFGHQPEEQAAKMREMLVSIIDDVRVALIKLAERTCAIRNVKNFPEEKRVRVAREIVDVYAPLAHRLGIGHLKWELEDLAFRYLEPLEYKRIARLLSEKRRVRQAYIDEVMDTLRAELDRVGIKGEVSGRAKHIFSIWKKMQRKGIGFSKVYDIRAVRVLVPTVGDCYTLLGIVHQKWQSIPEEFDDYIANPKENGYRSLHTAVVGPLDRVLEIQIRTFAMHGEAEFGICAHWQYKEADVSDSSESYEAKIAWLRQVLEWHDEIGGEEALAELEQVGNADRIYVFTPDGHVVDLPAKSTALDFAYRIHTQVGHRARGCKINGRIAPLNTVLQTTDQVEILIGKQESPSRDWLTIASGYLNSARTRAKVQNWFKKQDWEKHVASGKADLEKELRRQRIEGVDLNVVADKLNRKGRDGLYAAIGAGDLSLEQVLNAIRQQLPQPEDYPLHYRRSTQASRYKKSPFYIYGVGNMMTKIANCCNPLPGEKICGFITTARGVSIHRKDCTSLLRLKSREPERIIQVRWGGEPSDVYAVPLIIQAYDRSGLLRDITTVIDRQGISIDSLLSAEVKEGKTNTRVTVEVSDLKVLGGLIARLKQIPNVLEVNRVSE